MISSKPAVLLFLFCMLTLSFAEENEAEKSAFYNAGYNIKHYRLAQRLNLDVENYELYRQNKKDRVSGAVMAGVGSGLLASGAIYITAGIILKDDYYNDDYYYSYDDFTSNFYIITGSTLATGGLTSLIIGIVRRGRSRLNPVMKKDGTELGLRVQPLINPVTQSAGLQFSLNF